MYVFLLMCFFSQLITRLFFFTVKEEITYENIVRSIVGNDHTDSSLMQ